MRRFWPLLLEMYSFACPQVVYYFCKNMLIDAKLFLLNGACMHREVEKFNNSKSEVRLLSSAFCKFFLYVRFVCKGNNKKFLLIKRASLANGVLQSVQGKTALTDRLCCKGNYSAAILMTGSI